MLCSEPQKHTVPGARESLGRRPAPVCARHGHGLAGLGDKHRCDGDRGTPPSFCNPNRPVSKANESV